MLPSTAERVPQNTAEHVNEAIQRQTRQNLSRYADASPTQIERRLQELDREWDIERTLETNAAIASLIGLGLGATVSRKWFIFPAVVSAFLLQHALQGWCPPVPIFRRLGIRTQSEIERERCTLKAMRGDFRGVDNKIAAIGPIKRWTRRHCNTSGVILVPSIDESAVTPANENSAHRSSRAEREIC